MKRLTLCTAALALSACVNRPPPAPVYSQAADPTIACLQRLRQDPYLVSTLGPKTGFGTGASTIEQKADTSFANEEHKKAISQYSTVRAQCWKDGDNYRRATRVPPAILTQLEQNWAEIDALYLKLYVGEITFGQFNQMVAANGVQANERIRAAAAQVDRTRAEAQAADEAQKQAASAAFIQSMQNQLLIQQQTQNQQIQQNRPINTDCRRVLNQVNCTTY